MANAAEPAPKKHGLGRGFILVWGLASLGLNVIGGIFGALLPIFYQDYLGLSARWIGLASMIYAVWNALNDPIFGFISDSTRSKRGRRVPFMRFTAPFLGLTFALVWLAPRGAGEIGKFAWMLASMLLYDTCYTIIGLVYGALLPEMTESDEGRNALQISFSLFGLLGTLFGFLLPDLFRPKAGGPSSLLPLQLAMAVVGLVGALLIVATTLRVKERLEFSRVDKPLSLKDQIRCTLANRSFLVLVAQNFMSILVSSLVIGSVFYLADYVLSMPTIVLLAYIFVPLLGGVPVTNLLRRRLGLVGAQQLLLAIAGVGLTSIAFVPDRLIPFCLAAAGFGLSGPQTLTNIFFAQVADEDELKTGVRREGAFFGVNAMLTKPAQSIALAISPFILEATGFVPRDASGVAAAQSARAILGIKLFTGLIPGIAMIAGSLILFLFPIRGERLERMRKELLELHERKRLALEKLGQD